jgi:hypothetical protein
LNKYGKKDDIMTDYVLMQDNCFVLHDEFGVDIVFDTIEKARNEKKRLKKLNHLNYTIWKRSYSRCVDMKKKVKMLVEFSSIFNDPKWLVGIDISGFSSIKAKKNYAFYNKLSKLVYEYNNDM